MADRGIAAHRLDTPDNPCHIGNAKRAVADAFDRCLSNGIEIGRHGQIANHNFCGASVQKPSGACSRCIRGCALEFLQRDPIGLHAVGVRLNLDLANATAHVEHLCEAGDTLKAAFDC